MVYLMENVIALYRNYCSLRHRCKISTEDVLLHVKAETVIPPASPTQCADDPAYVNPVLTGQRKGLAFVTLKLSK